MKIRESVKAESVIACWFCQCVCDMKIVPFWSEKGAHIR